jgi:hypothetical protein
MIRPLRFALLLATLAAGASGGFAEEPAPLAARRFEVRRAAGAVAIDGALDDAGWQGALAWDVRYEWFPGENVAPPVATEVLVTYDDRSLYVAWRCHDPEPAAIRAHFMDRDSIDTFVQDDHVVLMIDPFDDERRGWQFRVNPLGVQADAIFSENEGIEDWSFDLIWASAAKIGAGGWTAEIAIPFSQLRFPRTAAPQTWGFDVGRSWPRNVRHRMTAAPRDRNRNCLLCQIDKVSGFAGIEPGRNVELDPTATLARTDLRAPFPGSSWDEGEEEGELGLTARWGITTDLTLSGAVNPDFSQVEADAAQLAVNQRFALFFPEKRPFFLEGVDFFATPIDAVFTRTVVDPAWGVKLTGKQGPSAIGAFVTADEATSLVVPSNQGSFPVLLDGEAVTASVLRYRHDVGANSTFGVLYAGREGDAYRNRVGGIDGFFRLSPTHTFRFQALGSRTRYPEALARELGQPEGDFDGTALFFDYGYQTRDWVGSLRWEERDREFRADSGFVPRVDFVEQRGFLQRIFWAEEGAKFFRKSIQLAVRRVEDGHGRLTDAIVDLSASLFGPLQSAVEVSLERREEFFGGVLYDGIERVELYSELQPTGALKLTLYADFGDAVDVRNGRLAEIAQLSPTLEAKLGRHFNAQLAHTFQKLDFAGGDIYEANLSQARLVWNFSTRLFVRAIVQHLDLEQNPASFVQPVDERLEELFTQLLVSYELNPQTVLFVGYSDNSFGTENLSLLRTDRTLFAKLGYALLF